MAQGPAEAFVLDRTGLDGTFDVDLRWSPEPTDLVRGDAARGALPVGDGPSFFTAIREQLGLKLEGVTDERRVLVIDRVERPDPN